MTTLARAAIAMAMACGMSWGAVAAAAAAAEAPWWRHEGIRGQLELTDEQVRAIDRLFVRDIEARRALHTELERVRRRFAQALSRDDTERATALVARLVDLEAQQNKRRTVMLLKMGWVLTRAQWMLLQDLTPASLSAR